MTGLPTSFTVLLDDGTGAFPYDISSYVMASGWNFSRGRQDWQGGVTAGSLSLTLNNSTGRFTPGSTLIASPSPIKVDQRLRVKETVNGVTLTRFTGYVKSWPVTWPATVGTIAMSSIRVVDAQARAERRVLRSVVEEEIMLDSPAGYWTCADAPGSVSAVDSSGSAAPYLVQVGTGTTVSFGATGGTLFDGALTGATLAGGKYLYPATPLSGVNAFEVCFSVSSPPGTTGGIVPTFDTAFSAFSGFYVWMDSTGHIVFGSGTTSSGTYADGQVHTVAYTKSGTPAVFIDGVSIGTDAIVGINTGNPISGTVSHYAAFSTSPGLARYASHFNAERNGFDGESGTARLTRLAAYAGIPVGTFDTSLTNVPYVDITTRSAWEAAQEVVDAEVGVIFIDELGALEFHNRNRNAAKASPDLSVVATSHVVPDVSPVDDDQQILNYVETTAIGTGVRQIARSALSESGNGTATNPGHGRYSDSKTYLVQTNPEALDRANWIIANFAEPTTRYGTLTVNLYAMPAAVAQAFLSALDIDTWLRVTQMASQNTGGTTVDVVVEGYTEQATGSSWSVTLNVVSRALFQAWILGDTTYGVLGTTTRLYI